MRPLSTKHKNHNLKHKSNTNKTNKIDLCLNNDPNPIAINSTLICFPINSHHYLMTATLPPIFTHEPDGKKALGSLLRSLHLNLCDETKKIEKEPPRILLEINLIYYPK